MVFKAAMPLIAGGAVFLSLMWSATAEGFWSSSNLAIVPLTPFQGVEIVYAMIVASLVTVGLATTGYLSELRNMADLARRTAGALEVQMARICVGLALVLIALYFMWVLFIKTNVNAIDACSLHVLHERVGLHDLCVSATFVLFLAADFLTLRGMEKARDACADEDTRATREEIELIHEFSKQQLWLIDFPVLIGFAISLLIVWSASLFSGWDNSSFYLNSSISNEMNIRRSTALFMCNGQSLDMREMQMSIVSIFSAGIAMGYLAAHVFMSQMVFITLNVFFSRKRARLHAANSHGPRA